MKTVFIRALEAADKSKAIIEAATAYRNNTVSAHIFRVDTDTFRSLPASSFAYWISPGVLQAFVNLTRFELKGYSAQVGASTKDDFRFLRLWWECVGEKSGKWFAFAKGGSFSPFYADIHLNVNWKDDARELEAAILKKYPYLGDSANWVLHRESNYLSPGITWPSRTKSRFGPRVLPSNCIFSIKGMAAFAHSADQTEVLCLLGIMSSQAFRRVIEIQLPAADAKAGGAANSYEVGIIRSSPLPDIQADLGASLAGKVRRIWQIRRKFDLGTETSHAFSLPEFLLKGKFGSAFEEWKGELVDLEFEINRLVSEVYGFTSEESADPVVISGKTHQVSVEEDDDEDAGTDDPGVEFAQHELLSWSVGIAFGRFDWRLATGERAAPAEPEPFDPLPARSPGMLPDGATPFHAHAGILVDDPGHLHDLARLVEDVLARVEAPVPEDLRLWLQRDFFVFHLQRYSKSRRKAPIYWPLSTTSGSYTLWVYYPSLTSQTLYTAVNDFVEPKLKQVGSDVSVLRNKGTARTRDDEKQFEALQAFELELIELRDTLLKLAPTYKPNHDDGVQITSAPLWPLFRHKPWQKVLKDTWAKLEKGDYDWAHLAMNYWPERVREKCKTDKSLAIAHGLEHLYVEPEAQPKKTRGRKKAGGDE